jgi:endonuclease YncB( thermonuclease family)
MWVARCLWPLVAALTLAIATPSTATELSGRVVHVADGDTITILDAQRTEHRVRLAGIDAPEKAQPFGDASRQALRSLVHGTTVQAACPKSDLFGRPVCTVRLGARDINLAQVQAGMAWWSRPFAKEQVPAEREAYAAAVSVSSILPTCVSRNIPTP